MKTTRTMAEISGLLTANLIACLAHIADICLHHDAVDESAATTLVTLGLAKYSGTSFDVTTLGQAMLDRLVHERRATKLVVAPFYADPYCGRRALILASIERPCRVNGYEIITSTGCMTIKDPSRLVTRIVPGHYSGALWQG